MAKTPLNERRIALVGDINEEMALGFFEVFERLDSTNGPITIRIVSGGGEAPAGFAIYDRIRQSKNHITTEAYGGVMSMAVPIFEAGDYRRISASTRLMIHNAAVEVQGTLQQKDFRRSSQEIKVLETMYNKVISQRTGIAMKQLEKWCDEETYFGANECITLNLADEIIENIEFDKPKKGKK